MADAQVTIKLSPAEARDMREALRDWQDEASERAKRQPKPGEAAELRELRSRCVRIGLILERI